METFQQKRNMKIKFTKMHGSGNDFLVFDGIHQQIDFTPEQWKKIANRRFGVGADQMLVVERSTLPEVDFRYRIFNADGGEVEHCGNGARAFLKFVHEKKLIKRTRIKVEIMKGVIELNLEADGNVTVEMNAPVLDVMQVPFDTTDLVRIAEEQDTLWPLKINNSQILISAISMGNPHAIQIVPDVEVAAVLIDGPLIERHSRFPEGANVGFMQIVDKHHIKLRVFERGAGETLACGTGACAAVVSGILRGKLNSPVTVGMHGGELTIRWAGIGQPVYLAGPAVTVFEGEINL
ncbi:MAG: diaminopimelate epimerase [Solimicrobium sp.]|nr:diaminopimelate epimerase [Solimicrobium sp.]